MGKKIQKKKKRSIFWLKYTFKYNIKLSFETKNDNVSISRYFGEGYITFLHSINQKRLIFYFIIWKDTHEKLNFFTGTNC